MAVQILSNSELDGLVYELELTDIENVGTKKWFMKREPLLKIYQVAMLEAKSDGDERVMNAFLEYDKLTILLCDIICISVWKEKVLPELLDLTPDPDHTFPTYIVLYHEVLMLGILQTILYHSCAFDKLADNAVDLVDYAVAQIINLSTIPDAGSVSKESQEDSNPRSVIERQRDIMNFNIGTQCVGILRYVSENLDRLPLIVSSRLYSVHDVPIVMAHLLEINVWQRRSKDGKMMKFRDYDWVEWSINDPALSQTECQAWLLLRQLLVEPNCAMMYEFTSYRKDQLSKLIRNLHDQVLDQLSPLIDLKVWLQKLSISGPQSNTTAKTPFILEINEGYRDLLYNRYKSRWKKIAQSRAELLFYASVADIQTIAKGLVDDFDNMKQVSEKIQTCSYCFSKAEKRCSKCKSAWYCSRQCQVKHWNAHKDACCA